MNLQKDGRRVIGSRAIRGTLELKIRIRYSGEQYRQWLDKIERDGYSDLIQGSRDNGYEYVETERYRASFSQPGSPGGHKMIHQQHGVIEMYGEKTVLIYEGDE